MPSEYLPRGRGDAESGFAQEVRRHAGERNQFLLFHCGRGARLDGAAWLPKVDEMVGRVDMIEMRPAIQHWKARGLDFSSILYNPQVPGRVGRRCTIAQDHGLGEALDNQLIEQAKPALEHGQKVEFASDIYNVHRAVGTMLSGQIARKYGSGGLPDDTIKIHFDGTAGQSFGAFLCRGVTLLLEGDANDYVGKGLSGGKIAVFRPRAATFPPEQNILIGNTVLYGATTGEAYFAGVAGERFAVRNSGATAVVEGVGDHACEYMTNGTWWCLVKRDATSARV